LKIDVIVTGDTNTTLVAKQATKAISIVAAVFTEDPVAAGLVDSLRRPGGKHHRNKHPRSELSDKRLELLREIVPDVTRVAVLWSRQFLIMPCCWREADHCA